MRGGTIERSLSPDPQSMQRRDFRAEWHGIPLLPPSQIDGTSSIGGRYDISRRSKTRRFTGALSGPSASAGFGLAIRNINGLARTMLAASGSARGK